MTAPAPIASAALAASAGTGKTFALSSRYIALLAAGAEPACLVALTFTRKAAGEILARILTRLANAARSPDGFDELNRQLADAALPGFAALADARGALRALVRHLPRLRIGTLDSFFFLILRQFRLELGIGTEPAIAEETGEAMDDLVLQRLLETTPLPEAEQEELLEAFRNATFGEDRKSIYASVQRLVQRQFELFQREPATESWGLPARIWPDGGFDPMAAPPAPDWPAIRAALETQADAFPQKNVRSGWLKFADLIRAVAEGGDSSAFDFSQAIAKQLYAAFAVPGRRRDAFHYYRRDHALAPETRTALEAAFAYIRHDLLARRIVRTRGLYRLLSAYARQHRAHIAASGRMSFNDIAQLLAPSSGLAPASLRLQLDARLDAQFRHWLLDEFQDTSLVQWAVIENLVDEILQNPDADRSLFYVGDTKQAIYEWRSGDPRLFRRILDKYAPAIAEAPPLVQSFRSSPVVLDAVNQVFGSLPDLPLPADEHLTADWPAVADRWKAAWKPHEAAPKNATLSGHVALHLLPRLKKDEEGPVPVTRAAEIVRDLRDTIPGFDRLSVALLARGNDDGLALVNALAALDIPAAWAGSTPLLDNVLLPAFLSLVKLLDHPGDSLAQRHVAMSPLAPFLSAPPPAGSVSAPEPTRADLPPSGPRLLSLARLVREQGYAGLAAHVAATLDLSRAPLEQRRLRTLIALAADFDRRPDPTAVNFIAFVQNQTLPAADAGSNIQVLTMHKAKGLEFDIVLLPALGDKGLSARAKRDVLVHEAPSDAPVPPVDWILSAPETGAIEAEPPLAGQLAADRQSKILEELRLLYVAMTRAKRSLHLLVGAPPTSWNVLRLDDVIRLGLAREAEPDPAGPVWQAGSPDWWISEFSTPSAGPRPAAPGVPPPAPLLPPSLASLPFVPAAPPLRSRIASREPAGGDAPAGRHFRPEGAAAREFGTRVHELFEAIEWLAPGEIPDFPDAPPGHVRLLAAFLEDPALHRFFQRPSVRTELLREQAFEAILSDGRWLSGKIDRLHLERDDDGTPLCAHVFDFKTDQTPDPERHRHQMLDYRQAVARLFSLPPGRIACTLLFLRTRQAVDIP